MTVEEALEFFDKIPKIKNKIQTLDTTTRVFCKEQVHYKGEPVGLIVGEDIINTIKNISSAPVALQEKGRKRVAF